MGFKSATALINVPMAPLGAAESSATVFSETAVSANTGALFMGMTFNEATSVAVLYAVVPPLVETSIPVSPLLLPSVRSQARNVMFPAVPL